MNKEKQTREYNMIPKNVLTLIMISATLVSMFQLVVPIVYAEGAPSEGQPPSFYPLGTLEGSGVSFELTDSEYLNITVESSESINLFLQSVPQMIIMRITPLSEAPFAQMVLRGLTPLTTYYKYEDSYQNLVTFTTDEYGYYAYTQDLSREHLVFSQPSASTIYLSNSGWSNPAVGTWNPSTSTGTLTTDLSETIEILDDGITLDGNGHTITGSSTGYGVYAWQRTGLTIKSLTVASFYAGISLEYSSTSTIAENTLTDNLYGTWIWGGSNLAIDGNVAVDNIYMGILLASSTVSTIEGNFASGNSQGICASIGTSYLVTGNTLEHNFIGFNLVAINGSTVTNNSITFSGMCGMFVGSHWLYGPCETNVIAGNTFSDNTWDGIYLDGTNNNLITDNIISTCTASAIRARARSSFNTLTDNIIINNSYGVVLEEYSNDNIIYHNNFINNGLQAAVYYCSGNIFNLPKPTGGNYWSDWTEPDNDCDGFVDEPYTFHGAQDNLPWTIESGWLDTAPPEITIVTPEPYGLYSVGVSLDFYATDASGVASIVGQLTNTAGEYQEVESGFTPQPGVYTLVVGATDNRGNTGESDPVFFVVYDPEGGFATGGGWIYPDAESTLPDGKAHFGFVAKYKQGSSAGNLEFQYQDADINLKSTTIDWLVISSVTAQFQGTGTINGEGFYTFRVLVKDNGEPGADSDQFNICIWAGTDTEADPIHKAKNIIAGGNIVIHK